jgi:hypothetical protein
MSAHPSPNVSGISVAGSGDYQHEAPATPSHPAPPSKVISFCDGAGIRVNKSMQVDVDEASLNSPDMEVDESGTAAPRTPAPNSLDAANKKQEEDLKLKYGGVLPDRAALLRRDYQKVLTCSDAANPALLKHFQEHRFVDSADQAMDKAGKVDPLRQPMTSKSALPPHMRNL